ncbi:PTS transporter subunit EIIC [Virgibacillus pantothenticus]|uniref:PTS transporter subunit EIIC n=1 Tax=Virgibacillus TaxID=84406 RepID=UPI0009FA289C|nr:PTS transporter subunit EIIC [Virgibacillus pantothenticus]MBS7428727.1 PTS transporter subunit EIIC [Virgibacillus sp. 19R1-5]MBU8565743.1 PTS transporter subunit EIIC [Virgibacillus pantothenticus]MBU8599670.1 PTS transporter subunit EIIC [Virgibacillus pantothenticus]MBU8634117.1 PTS transporter subunit EIIC [Virgibacillus pantothenticus]MBU8642158.1 PTS transporter subunit EIIC [Virgibacillus pantothenticus]
MTIIICCFSPLGLAKTAAGRAAVESFVIYIIFNYFIETILSFWGSSFGVDFSSEVGGTSGLTMIAGIKTLDMSVIGAILIAAIVAWIHNKCYESKLPEVLSVFQGSALVVIIGFICMIPLAFFVSWFWRMVHQGIVDLQGLLTKSGNFGVWLFILCKELLSLQDFIIFSGLYVVSSPISLHNDIVHNSFSNFFVAIEYIFLTYLEMYNPDYFSQ